MKIYHYHPGTGEYVGNGTADESPLEPGVFLIPANATADVPPTPGTNKAAVYTGGVWGLTPDHRGMVYWLADGTEHSITALGEVPPVGALTAKPPPTLVELKAAKVAELSAACKAAIVSGFQSGALGSLHTYDSDLESQVNLIGAASLGGPVAYTCTDEAGVKLSRTHTKPQLMQVLTDGATLKIQHLASFRALKNQALAATTEAELNAIVW